MAFTLSDPSSRLFWSLTSDKYSLSNVNPATFVQEGSYLKNVESNKYVRVTDFTLVDSEFDAVNEEMFHFQFEEKGGINWFPGRVFSVCDNLEILPAQVNEGIDWVRTSDDVPDLVSDAEEPVVAEEPEAAEEPEVAEEPESEDDVPVARGSALIEESLNAMAADNKE